MFFNRLGEIRDRSFEQQRYRASGFAANGESYADKYRQRGEPIYLVGVEFSKTDRNIVGFEVERVAG